jgi:hypothetical protein
LLEILNASIKTLHPDPDTPGRIPRSQGHEEWFFARQSVLRRGIKMDDFLYNVRTGAHKRQDGNRKQYGNYSNRGHDRQRAREGRNGSLQRDGNQDQWSVIRKTLEDISGDQKRIAEASEREAKAAERQAEALENISVCLGYVPPPKATVAPDIDETPPVSPLETEQPEDIPVEISAEAEREKIMAMILDMRKQNVSYVKIAAHLTSMGIPTFSGRGQWRGHAVSTLCRQ